MVSKNTICLWFDGTALEAAQFYAATFPTARLAPCSARPPIIPPGRRATY